MLIHSFNDSNFPQSEQDQYIANVLIPQGYVNASLMCKNWGKQIKMFMRQKSTKLFIEALEKDINNGRCFKRTAQEMTQTTEEVTENTQEWVSVTISLTEKNKASNEYRGVWVHPELAIELAGWLNVDFKLWANRVLRLVIEDKIETIEFDEAQRNLQWEYLRAQSKAARRKFTDCLREYLIETKGESFYKSPGAAKEFARYTALAQAKLTGFPSFNGTRDNCTDRQLKILEDFETKFVAGYELGYPDIMDFDEIFDRALAKTAKKFSDTEN